MLISESQLIARISEILGPFGCEASALGPHGFRQKDFGHVYGPSVIVRPLCGGPSTELLARMTSEVVSKVSGITGLSVAS